MKTESAPDKGEANFIHDQFVEYTGSAINALATQFLGDDADKFKQDIQVIHVEGEDQGEGNAIPIVSCDFSERKLLLIIEEHTIMNFAEQFISEIETHDFGRADLTRLLVGAGVARSLLAWKTLPIVGEDISQEEKEAIQDQLCNKKGLWEMAEAYDTEHKTRLRPTVEKLNDDQVAVVNALRFAFGVSLNYLSDVHDLQIKIPQSFIERLNEQEEARRLDLRMNMAILDKESAYTLYDDSAPLLELALSFPMSPGEQQSV